MNRKTIKVLKKDMNLIEELYSIIKKSYTTMIQYTYKNKHRRNS